MTETQEQDITKDPFIDKVIQRARTEWGKGYKPFVLDRILHYNPETKTFVLEGSAANLLRFVYGQGEDMQGKGFVSAGISCEGVRETESELTILLAGVEEYWEDAYARVEPITYNKPNGKVQEKPTALGPYQYW